MESMTATIVVGIIVLLIICAALFVLVRDRITGRSGCERGCLVCRSCKQNVRIDDDGKEEKDI